MDKPLVLLTVFSNDQEIKKKPVRASTYAELVALAKEICPVVEDCELSRFFVYSEDFEEYVDADEDHEVAQKEKFQLFFTVCSDYGSDDVIPDAIPPSGERVYILPESLTSKSPHGIASQNINSVNCTLPPNTGQFVGYSGTVSEEVMCSDDAQRPEGTVHLYERHQTPVATLNPEYIRQRSMIYGKNDQRNLNQYEIAINDMAFKLAMDNPALLRDRKQLLVQSKRMIHGSGYLYAQSKKSRSKMFGTPSVKVMEETQRHDYGPHEIVVGHEEMIVGEYIGNPQDQVVHGEPLEEHSVGEVEQQSIEQQSVLYGKKGKRPLTRYQIAMNNMALTLAEIDPSLLKDRGQFLRKTREMLHKTGYRYARSGRSRSKVFGELDSVSNKHRKRRKIVKPDGQKEACVDETPAAVVETNQEVKGEEEIVDHQVKSWKPVIELTPDLIENQSKIFGYKKNRSLTKYEHAINKMAFEVATENPELLKHRGRLLNESRKRLHKSGYRYARCQSSRSKVFGSPCRVSPATDSRVFKDGNFGGIVGNVPLLMDNNPSYKSFAETESCSTVDNAQHSSIHVADEKRKTTLAKTNTTAIKFVRYGAENRAENSPSNSDDIGREFLIYGRNGNRKLTKYESAMNKVALELATNDPTLVRNRGQFLARCRLMLHMSGYRYARCQKSRSKVFGNPSTTSNVAVKHGSKVADENLQGTARNAVHDTTDNNIPCEIFTEFDNGDVVHNSSTFPPESEDINSDIDDVTIILTKQEPVESEDTAEQCGI